MSSLASFAIRHLLVDDDPLNFGEASLAVQFETIAVANPSTIRQRERMQLFGTAELNGEQPLTAPLSSLPCVVFGTARWMSGGMMGGTGPINRQLGMMPFQLRYDGGVVDVDTTHAMVFFVPGYNNVGQPPTQSTSWAQKFGMSPKFESCEAILAPGDEVRVIGFAMPPSSSENIETGAPYRQFALRQSMFGDSRYPLLIAVR
jgi:hypothetical protein